MATEVIYQGKYGPSGAGDALFDLLKQSQAKEMETFKSEIRMKEAAQASGFATALETLREKAREARAVATF